MSLARSLGFVALFAIGCDGAEQETAPMDAGPDLSDTLLDTGELSDTETLSLTVPTGWTEVAPDDDFVSGRPLDAECDPGGWGEEDGLFELDSELCSWLSVEQGSLATVEVGDSIALFFSHDQLWFETPSRANVELFFDGTSVWSESVPIPSSPGFFNVTWESSVRLDQGAPIGLHIDNHGLNTYQLVTLTVTH